MKAALAGLLLALAGCASTGVVPMDGNDHFVHKKSMQPGFGSPDGAVADVYQEAASFCARLGKRVETARLDVVNPLFLRPGSASLRFNCV
jgi:hypothetical protein